MLLVPSYGLISRRVEIGHWKRIRMIRISPSMCDLASELFGNWYSWLPQNVCFHGVAARILWWFHVLSYHPFSTKIPSSGSPVHHWPEILVFTAHQSAEVFRHSRFWRCWIAAIGSYPRRCSNRDTAPGRPLQGARGCSGATTVTPSSSFFYVSSQHPKAMNDRESHHRTVVWKLARAASQSTSIMQLALQYCIQEIVGMQCSN